MHFSMFVLSLAQDFTDHFSDLREPLHGSASFRTDSGGQF